MCLKNLHELFGQCSAHKAPKCAPYGDAPHISVRFRQRCQPCSHQRLADNLENFGLCKAVACSEQQLGGVGVIEQHLELMTLGVNFASSTKTFVDQIRHVALN